MSYVASLLSFLFSSAHTASAHVAYVADTKTLEATAGTDFTFLLSPFNDTNNIVMMICLLLMLGASYYLAHHLPAFVKELSYVKKQLQSYQDYVPWILRLGLGIMLMGAGMHSVLISPISPTIISVAALEFIVGFAVLFGFLLTPGLLIIIGFYLTGLFNNGYMFGNLEVFGSAIALFLIASNKPGFDHLVGIPMLFRDRLKKYAPLILRIALGGAFIFLAFYEKIFNPHFFSTVVESFNLTSIIPVTPAMWTLSVGLIELIVGLCIIFGFKTRVTSAIAFVVFICTFFFFKESVYSHVTIFAGLSSLFIMGGGYLSIDEHIAHKTERGRSTSRKLSGTKTTITRKPRKKTTNKRKPKTA
ncbi:MAG: DoxX family protein [Candidatus Pacebacteria bacterium]|jgi:uncharacterized membrane protein YphA (DoxX/SURF4 family)|nr:DoxX family protein [Candidatus Paceibacterota bacterium]